MTFEEFCGVMTARMEQGAREYGDASFYKTEAELVREGAEEFADLVGWGYILWLRAVGRPSDGLRHLAAYLRVVAHASVLPPDRPSPVLFAIWMGAMGHRGLVQVDRLRNGSVPPKE